MLRPGYPGGVPYPPRPGEQSALRYIIPGALGAPPPPPPSQSPYSARDGVYGRPPQVDMTVWCVVLTTEMFKQKVLKVSKSVNLLI